MTQFSDVKKKLHRAIFKISYWFLVKRLSKKKKINVAFFLFNADTWKADSVYKALENSERFIPWVIICPHLTKGNLFFKEQFQYCIKLVRENNYRYVIGFEGKDIDDVKFKKTSYYPIVFYLNPNTLTLLEYTIYRNLRSLNCYIPYSFNIDNLVEYEYNNNTLNLMYRVFTLSEYHHKNYIKYSEVKGKNSFVSGFPQFDRFFKPTKVNPWRSKNTKRKKIIWGPHWTIPNLQKTGLDWSCFLDYFDIILRFADKYKNDIEFALKPHPFLFNLLRKEENWGESRTTDYIEQWKNRENCQLVYGDYTDLFVYSDALIHDSGSFAVEYLCIYKPVSYTVNNPEFLNRFNDVGKKAIELHYKIYSEDDLEFFLINVINGIDTLELDRKRFVKNILMTDGDSGTRIVKHLEEIVL